MSESYTQSQENAQKSGVCLTCKFSLLCTALDRHKALEILMSIRKDMTLFDARRTVEAEMECENFWTDAVDNLMRGRVT